MNKPFGAQGEIINFPFKDLQETLYDRDGIELAIQGGILYVGVDEQADLEKAKDMARLRLAAWSERHQIKTTVDFNHSWQAIPQGIKNHNVTFRASVQPVARLQVQTTTHQITIQGVTASVITQQLPDSASFTHDEAMVQKAQKYPALKSALLYYNEEIVDDDRPLYGIYKALEGIITSLQETYKLDEKKARKKLAELVCQPLAYVEDVIQTSNVKRHHKTSASKKLEDDECQRRAKILIDAFARFLS